jgi:hypothetical protein
MNRCVNAREAAALKSFAFADEAPDRRTGFRSLCLFAFQSMAGTQEESFLTQNFSGIKV